MTAPAGTKNHLVQNYLFRDGRQLARFHRLMREELPPAIFLEAQVAAHLPQLVRIAGFESRSSAVPPCEYFSQRLLSAVGPDAWPASDRDRPCLYELRTWEAGPPHQILPGCGIHPILCGSDGGSQTYLLRFADLSARQKAWDAWQAEHGRVGRVVQVTLLTAVFTRWSGSRNYTYPVP